MLSLNVIIQKMQDFINCHYTVGENAGKEIPYNFFYAWIKRFITHQHLRMMQSTLETLQNITFILVNTSEKVTCNQKYHASH